MKRVLSLTLIVCVTASAFPVDAWEIETAGPLAQAIVREATTRLAGAGEPRTPVMQPVQTGGNPAVSDWSPVRTLPPGTEVVVTLKDAEPGSRYFAWADESALAVLNLTDPALPPAATRVLLDIVARHPEYFAGSAVRGRFESKSVRVGPDGIFVAGQKVGDLDHLVERVARADVSEIKRPVARRSVARGVAWGLGGFFAGGMVGAFAGAVIDCWIGGCDEDNIPAGGAVGFPVGMVAGAILGYRKGARAPRPKPEDVIYRAPAFIGNPNPTAG